MGRLSNLADAHSKWDVVALTGDCAGVLPRHWNDWPQPLKLSVPGNHDSPETFLHLTSWIHKTPWFRRYNDLAFLGIDTSDLSSPFGRLEEQLDTFWDEDITSVTAFVLLTHQWPRENEVNETSQLLAKFIDKRRLLVLDGHNHPRGTRWKRSEALGPITCFRSTVISCNVPKGNANLVTWNGSGFERETVRGEYEKPTPSVGRRVSVTTPHIRLGKQTRRERDSHLNAETRSVWILCKCGLSQKGSHRTCSFCGRTLRDQ